MDVNSKNTHWRGTVRTQYKRGSSTKAWSGSAHADLGARFPLGGEGGDWGWAGEHMGPQLPQ